MPTVRRLDAQEAIASLPALSAILADCVEGGASVGFMSPFAPADAEPYWLGVAAAVERGEVLLFAAELDGEMTGTVQIGFALKPNQPHRADLMKLLVHRKARGRGLSKLLMRMAETEAARLGRTLLVLDTATGEPAEALYEKLGWQRCGVIPGYALFPDGRPCDTTIFCKQMG